MKRYGILIFMAIVFLAGCKKDEIQPTKVVNGKIELKIGYRVSDKPLLFDTLLFTNEAGERYSIAQLQYYLSDIKFYRAGALLHSCPAPIYVDAKYDTVPFVLSGIEGMPTGSYDSVSLLIGLDSNTNLSNSLPATAANMAMGWPDAMGGGYHFLKLEGHWQNAAALPGFAMHLGVNGFQVKAGFKCALQVAQPANTTIHVVMNVNEWFCNPSVYSFNTDGVFSMGNSALMQKLSDNGKDVLRGE